MARLIKHHYFDFSKPGSFSGASGFAKAHGLAKNEVQKWLRGVPAYSLHKDRQLRFPRRQVITFFQDDLWESDLCQMTNIAEFNDGVKYILLILDVHSKFARFALLKDKKGGTVAKAFRSILDESDRVPNNCRFDSGGEYKSAELEALLNEYGINFYYCLNPETKCCNIERLIRTIRQRLGRYFTHTKNFRYVDIFENLIFSYNRTYHRSIRMTPFQALTADPKELFKNLYKKKNALAHPNHSNLTVGDYVRIVRLPGFREKAHEPRWTLEVFKISKITAHPKFPSYTLKDLSGSAIKGTFHKKELQKVAKPKPADLHPVERIVERKTVNGQKLVLVKWQGYPNSFNTWLRERDVVRNE